MKTISAYGKYNICRLDKNTAVVNAKVLAQLADSIPLVEYSEDDILADSKPGRIFHGKWEHSLAAFHQEKPIAVIIGYEREKEENDLYPENSIYISELAVDNQYRKQGLARELLYQFLSQHKSFLHLQGKLRYSIQTNSDEWNKYVIDLYKAFGFKQVGTKAYDNRTDVVLGLEL
jgi:ribosomal protein S18 acetylase RimI-like enzyme